MRLKIHGGTRSDARTKKIGFVRARDLKAHERHVLDEDEWA